MITYPTTHCHRRTLPLVPLLVGLGSLSLVLISCDQRGKTAKAVQKSSNQLQAISDGFGPPPGEKFTRTQYEGMVETLKPVSDTGLPGERAAVFVLNARAQIGLALKPAGEASAQESESKRRIHVIRSLSASWIEANAAASAREQFDPNKLVEESQKESAQKVTQAEAMRQAKAAIDAKVSDLRSQAQAKMTEAKGEEDQYATLKEQASKLTAIKAEPVIKQAAEHKRAADRLRTQAQMLEAQADQIAPQSAEAQLQVVQFENQKKNLDTTASQLIERAQASKAEAAAARAEAAKIAAQLDQALDELRTQRTGPLNDAFQQAAQKLQAAASTAQKAGAADPAASKMTVGEAQQTLGDLNWTHAHGLESYRILLDTLAKIQPPLPQKDKYAKEAEDTAAARKEALQAAKDAYEAAQNAFAAVKARGEAKDRLDRLSAQLEKVVKYTGGDSTDLDFTRATPSAEAAPTDASAPPVAAAPPGVPPELMASIDGFLAALQTEDFTAIRPFLYVPPNMTTMLDAMGTAAASQKKLETALRAKFNAGVEDMIKQTPLGAFAAQMSGNSLGGMDAKKLKGVKAADLKITLAGEKAAVAFPGTAAPAEFVHTGAKWLLDIGFGKLNPEQAAMTAKIMGPMGQALEELAADVQAGKFQTLQAVSVAFLQKLQPIIGQLGGAGAPGSKGGGGGG